MNEKDNDLLAVVKEIKQLIISFKQVIAERDEKNRKILEILKIISENNLKLIQQLEETYEMLVNYNRNSLPIPRQKFIWVKKEKSKTIPTLKWVIKNDPGITKETKTENTLSQ